MKRRAGIASGMFLASALLASAPARAEIAWTAPPSCPSVAFVRDRAKALAPADSHEPEAEATVRTEGDRFIADVRVNSAGMSGSRRIEGNTCADVAEAVALVLAMSGENSAAAPAPPVESRPRESPPERHREEDDRVRFVMGAFGALESGILAAAAPGGALTLGVSYRSLHAEVQGALLSNQRIELRPGVGGDFSEWGALARVCSTPRFDIVRIGPCVGMGIVRVTGTGVGAERSFHRGAVLAAPEVALLATVAFSRTFALRAHVSVGVPLSRPRFVLDNVGEVHRPGIVSASAFLGPEIGF